MNSKIVCFATAKKFRKIMTYFQPHVKADEGQKSRINNAYAKPFIWEISSIIGGSRRSGMIIDLVFSFHIKESYWETFPFWDSFCGHKNFNMKKVHLTLKRCTIKKYSRETNYRLENEEHIAKIFWQENAEFWK